jgi:hypothetical protein
MTNALAYHPAALIFNTKGWYSQLFQKYTWCPPLHFCLKMFVRHFNHCLAKVMFTQVRMQYTLPLLLTIAICKDSKTANEIASPSNLTFACKWAFKDCMHANFKLHGEAILTEKFLSFQIASGSGSDNYLLFSQLCKPNFKSHHLYDTALLYLYYNTAR